jgi:hypothetical protein
MAESHDVRGLGLHREAVDAIRYVAEGYCPLCDVRLVIHDGLACCVCGGCSYRLLGDLLELHYCAVHTPKRCLHWQLVEGDAKEP